MVNMMTLNIKQKAEKKPQRIITTEHVIVNNMCFHNIINFKQNRNKRKMFLAARGKPLIYDFLNISKMARKKQGSVFLILELYHKYFIDKNIFMMLVLGQFWVSKVEKSPAGIRIWVGQSSTGLESSAGSGNRIKHSQFFSF